MQLALVLPLSKLLEEFGELLRLGIEKEGGFLEICVLYGGG